MTIRDRGAKKWTSLMLPEHIAMLRQFNDDYYLVEKPIVDEFAYDEFDERIAYAMEYNMPVKITEWHAGRFTEVVGRVHYVDPITKQLRVKTTQGFERLNMADVTAVEIVADNADNI